MMDELPSRKIKDIRGERFGRLLVESFSHIAENKGRNAYWTCKCDCGNITTVSSGTLRVGSTQSCGCYAAEISRKLIKMQHTKGKHLYFIRSGRFIKIGRADNVGLRLIQINAMNPFGAHLIEEIKNAGYLEHSLHEKFRHLHHKGEWFHAHKDILSEVINVGRVEYDG